MSKRNPYEGRINSRKSIWYPMHYVKSEKLSDFSGYTYMLMEDLRLGIMPIAGRTKDSNFAVKINPPSNDIEELVRIGLKVPSREPRDIAEAVCNFVEETAHIIAYYGKAYYEIVFFYTNEKKSKINGFVFENISNYSMSETMGSYRQFIPKRVIEERFSDLKGHIYFDKDELFIICFPKELGGAKKIKKVISDLQWMGKYSIPGFALKNMATQQQTEGFDFKTYRENQDVFLAKITRDLGWTARGLISEKSLEFYQIYRYLKFQKTKSILRNYIIRSINNALEFVGKKMNFKAQIELEDLLSVQDYDRNIEKLVEGSLGFLEAIKL
ncbi:MAG TPA: hypothetical protein VMX17_15935 [Candidatus Glassbacteria bacterium]|nr:hypothetical protein [Candidatus Glassbacteria bacterium]